MSEDFGLELKLEEIFSKVPKKTKDAVSDAVRDAILMFDKLQPSVNTEEMEKAIEKGIAMLSIMSPSYKSRAEFHQAMYDSIKYKREVLLFLNPE